MKAYDGKNRFTDVLKTKDMLRLIQSIPSPKAEPFKLWLAEVGNDRLEEIADPQKAFDRAIEYYRDKGYSEEWIQQRLRGIDIRRKLTEQYNLAGITESKDYARVDITWNRYGHLYPNAQNIATDYIDSL